MTDPATGKVWKAVPDGDGIPDNEDPDPLYSEKSETPFHGLGGGCGAGASVLGALILLAVGRRRG